MAELTTEQRFVMLEQRVAELEHQRAVQEERDIALLARIDNFIDDLRRVERVQMRAFDDLKAGQKQLEARVESVETDVAILIDAAESHKEAIDALTEIARDHKAGIESLAQQVATLAAGQQQIITLLTGGPSPRND